MPSNARLLKERNPDETPVCCTRSGTQICLAACRLRKRSRAGVFRAEKKNGTRARFSRQAACRTERPRPAPSRCYTRSPVNHTSFLPPRVLRTSGHHNWSTVPDKPREFPRRGNRDAANDCCRVVLRSYLYMRALENININFRITAGRK